MKNIVYISVIDILRAKYGKYLVPNLIDFQLFRTENDFVVSKVTESNNDSGVYTYIMRTDYQLKGSSEKLKEWFENLSNDETFFYFDRIFEEDPPSDNPDFVYIELEEE